MATHCVYGLSLVTINNESLSIHLMPGIVSLAFTYPVYSVIPPPETSASIKVFNLCIGSFNTWTNDSDIVES